MTNGASVVSRVPWTAIADMRLPPGTGLRIDGGVVSEAGVDDTTVLIGGSPLRLLRLRPRAVAVVDGMRNGATLPPRASANVATLARRLVTAGMAHAQLPSANAAAPGEVTIVIPVHDRHAALQRLLASLEDMRSAVAEVVVVDDGSTDGTGDVARRWGARVVQRDGPSGPAAARNAGLATVRSPLVMFLDSDCEAMPGWLDPLLAHLADPLSAMVAPRVRGAAGEGSAIGRYDAVRSPLDLGPSEGRVAAGTRISYVPSAALLCRVDALRLLDGFDETMHVGEDVDLVWRLSASGAEIRFEPSSEIVHHDRSILAATLRRRYAYGTSAAALDRRHRGSVAPLALSPWTAAAWFAALGATPVGFFAGIAIAAGSAAALPRKLTMLASPWPVGLRLAGRGHLGAWRTLADAARRAYLPIVALSAARSRRARSLLGLGLLADLLEWRARRPALDPIRYSALRIADDAAYCAGVWAGCARERSLGPLVPRMTNWPGRRSASEDAG